MYLEMIDQVLPALGKIYVVEEGGTQPIPLLNLGERPLPLRVLQQAEEVQ